MTVMKLMTMTVVTCNLLTSSQVRAEGREEYKDSQMNKVKESLAETNSKLDRVLRMLNALDRSVSRE